MNLYETPKMIGITAVLEYLHGALSCSNVFRGSSSGQRQLFDSIDWYIRESRRISFLRYFPRFVFSFSSLVLRSCVLCHLSPLRILQGSR